ncbi:CopD family protein [Aureimonas populi]|uniref:CopD family protein n=1 Tax=Aureimonas populi TaxID=1701758 RepID=A0ABW5CND6_9HYPH|nr:CopD family protein [Aureimonas populi]
MIVWLKAFHIIALSIWCAGLITVPAMLARRTPGLAGEPLYELQKITRFAFVVVISPAAFIAIGTGTALIFARETFTFWFAIKLLLVGVLAKLHIRAGASVVEVFKEDGTYPLWRMALGMSLVALVVAGILVAVLAKPTMEELGIPAGLMRPGGLGQWLGFAPQPSSEITMPMP